MGHEPKQFVVWGKRFDGIFYNKMNEWVESLDERTRYRARFVSQRQLVRANDWVWLNCRQSFDTLKKTSWYCSTSFTGQSNSLSCTSFSFVTSLSWTPFLSDDLLHFWVLYFVQSFFIWNHLGTLSGKNFQGVESPANNTYWLWSASIPSFPWVCLPFSFHNPAFLVAWGVPRSATAVIRGKGRTKRSFRNCSPYFLGVARSWSDFLTEIVRKGSVKNLTIQAIKDRYEFNQARIDKGRKIPSWCAARLSTSRYLSI